MMDTKKLKALRVAKGFNQTQFAQKIGLSRSHYSHVENGERGASYPTLLAIAKGLDTTVENLMLDGELLVSREIVIEHYNEKNQTRTRYVLPKDPDTYRFIAEQLAGNNATADPDLLKIILCWNDLTNLQKQKIHEIFQGEACP